MTLPNEYDVRRLGHGMFVTAIHTNAQPEWVHTFASFDGINWTEFGNASTQVTARDPSLLHYDGQWWIAATAGNTTTQFGLWNSPDLDNWTNIGTPTTLANAANTWAPHWFVDHDGSVHILVAVKVGTNFQIYEMHPTSRDMSTWSMPIALSGAGFPSLPIDPCIIHPLGSDTYYLFFKDNAIDSINLAISTSLLTGWNVIETHDWAGWMAGIGSIEGPQVVQLDDGRWRLYFVNNSAYTATNIYYSETTDPSFQSAWSARVALPDFSGYNHPLPIRMVGTRDLEERLLALLGAPNGIATLDNRGDLQDANIPTTGVVTGTYGDSLHVGQFTVDSRGRIRAAQSVTITATGEQIVADGMSAPPVTLTNETEDDWLYQDAEGTP